MGVPSASFTVTPPQSMWGGDTDGLHVTIPQCDTPVVPPPEFYCVTHWGPLGTTVAKATG